MAVSYAISHGLRHQQSCLSTRRSTFVPPSIEPQGQGNPKPQENLRTYLTLPTPRIIRLCPSSCVGILFSSATLRLQLPPHIGGLSAADTNNAPTTMDHDQSVQYLEGLLGRTLRIHTTDTRMFVGLFKCTDAVSSHL